MIIWEKIDKSVNSEGTTITYRGVGTQLLIQSRKRHVPHANREGTWEHTTYVVLDNGKEVVTKYRMMDAKQYAEGLIDG